MKNNSKTNKISLIVLIFLSLFNEVITANELMEENKSIISIECEHLMKKIQWAIPAKSKKVFSKEEKQFLITYLETSLESIKLLINSDLVGNIVFQNIDSEWLRTDARMLMNQRLNVVTQELFQLPFIPDDHDEFIKRLKAAQLAIAKVSDILPAQELK